MSSNINVENLVEKSRFPKSVNETLGLIAYFPFGVILAVLRIFIALNAICFVVLLSQFPIVRRPFLRILLGVLGFLVIEKKNSASQNSRVLVSNHLSLFDHIALYSATGAYTPTKVFSTPVAMIFGLVSSDIYDDGSNESIALKDFLSTSEESLVLFPEEDSTNGKYALLRFSTLPAVLSDDLQPVVITVKRPSFANVNLSVLGSRAIPEIFWFLFVPFTKFEYKLLSVIKRSEDESNRSLMSRVEKAISQELNISISKFTKKDKEQYKKKYFSELADKAENRNQPAALYNFEDDPEILRMSAQVSDVLPLVPKNVIKANLRRTRCVDITITNLLDGTVKYIPLPQSSKEPKLTTKTEPDNFGVGSFMERKTKLIDAARERYIKKHGLHQLVQ